METKHITKGEWIAEFGNVLTAKRLIANCIGNGSSIVNEDRANAELIAEAGTVTNECGLSPRQLKEQRDEVLEALKLLFQIYQSETVLNKENHEHVQEIIQRIK